MIVFTCTFYKYWVGIIFHCVVFDVSKLHVSVNNAGTINKNSKIWEVSAEDFDSVMDTNVKGVVNVLRHFIPLMLPRKQGIIVNMSSGWGRSGAALVSFIHHYSLFVRILTET